MSRRNWSSCIKSTFVGPSYYYSYEHGPSIFICEFGIVFEIDTREDGNSHHGTNGKKISAYDVKSSFLVV